VGHSVHSGPSPILGAATHSGQHRLDHQLDNPYRAAQPISGVVAEAKVDKPSLGARLVQVPLLEMGSPVHREAPWVLGSPASKRNFNPIEPYPKPLLESKPRFPPQIFPKKY
jgi:hypothetical protein